MNFRRLAVTLVLLRFNSSSSFTVTQSVTAPNHFHRTLQPVTRSLGSVRLFGRGRSGGGKKEKGKVGNMPRGVKKENLPEKVCVTCGRPFTWRKKWERCWDEVTTCSKSCNAARRRGETNTLADKQERKEARKAKREGKADPMLFAKPCTVCGEGEV